MLLNKTCSHKNEGIRRLSLSTLESIHWGVPGQSTGNLMVKLKTTVAAIADLAATIPSESLSVTHRANSALAAMARRVGVVNRLPAC